MSQQPFLPDLVLPVGTTEPPAPATTFRWATVTQASPLRIRFDGESFPLAMTPETLVDPATLAAGDRLWVQLFGLRVIVIGRSGG